MTTVEHEPLDRLTFDDPDNAAEWVRALAGPEGSPGEESFDVFVCTSHWLANEVASVEPAVEPHRLVVDRWEVVRVEEAVRHAIESETASTWAELGQRIGRFSLWEFDGYRP